MNKFRLRSIWRYAAVTLASGDLKAKLVLLSWLVLGLVAVGATGAFLLFRESLGNAIWWSWTHVMDPGFMGDDKDSRVKQICGSVVSVMGLILIGGAFISLAEESAKRAIDRMMRGRLPKGLEGHTVIAGKGAKLKTVLDALQSLSDRPSKQSLIIVTPDPSSLVKDRQVCGNEVNIIVDSIQEEKAQERIMLPFARRLFLLNNFGGDTGGMLEAICNLHDLRTKLDHRKQMTVYAEVNDRHIAASLRTSLNEIMGRSDLEVHIMNLNDSAARLALRENPLDCVPVMPDSAGKVVLIIDGWSPFAQALFWQAIRVCHFASSPTRIIVVHPESERIRDEVVDAAPGLFMQWCKEELVHVEFVLKLAPVDSIFADTDIVTVALCDPNEDKAFARALLYRKHSFRWLRQIFIELSENAGYQKAIPKLNTTQTNKKIVPVGLQKRVFELAEQLDVAAKALHEQYLKMLEADNKRDDTNEGHNDWVRLDETRRSWNRTPVDHIDVKLRTLSDFYHLDPRPKYDPNTGRYQIHSELWEKIQNIIKYVETQQGGDDLEILAKIEHHRWCAEKTADGWKHSEIRNDILKLHPLLLPYDSLTAGTKAINKKTVCEVLNWLRKNQDGTIEMGIQWQNSQ